MAKSLVRWKKLADVGKSPAEEAKGKPEPKVEGSTVRAKRMYSQKVVTRGMPSRG